MKKSIQLEGVTTQEEIREAARLLVEHPIVTDAAMTVRIDFNTLIIETERISTFLACRIMLRHWGFIS